MLTKTLTAKSIRAITSYGADACREAYRLHATHGEGARTIAEQYSIPGIRNTRQADAAIDAGRELAAI
jgi:hypothetical protein